MKLIHLNHGKAAIVDDDDYEWLSDFTWYAANLGKKPGKDHWYAVTCVGGRKNQKTILMHRLLSKGRRVDHRDRNGLNNQRKNLRPANGTQNNANASKRSGGTSKFKGVHLEKCTNKWRAKIQNYGKSFSLGRFLTQKEAARAYDVAAKRQFGAFALTNSDLFHEDA